jgi:acetyl esterase/lipase
MLRMSFRAFSLLLALGLSSAIQAQKAPTSMPLWPHATPEPPQVTEPETDIGHPAAGRPPVSLTNVTIPTLTVYPPTGIKNTGAAALVFPGGGYVHLAWTKEGLDTCDWLNSIGMTCLLVKYRVPEQHYPESHADLEDAQQALRLARAHATEWHIDADRVGVLGFSAGGNLAALMSTHSDDDHVTSTPAASDANTTFSAKPDFAILVYPAYLAISPEQTALDPVYTPNALTPPTFLVAAENDSHYGKNSPVYYRALTDATVPAELHMFATGGHGFGVYPAGTPGEWPELAAAWLRSIKMLPALPHHVEAGSTTGASATTPGVNPVPCTTVSQPPQPGRPDKPTQADAPPCY